MGRRIRKTVAVADLKDRVNKILAHAPTTRQNRIAVASLLEGVLMDTGNYKGFQYLHTELDLNGQLRPKHDDTRRRYI